MIPIAHGRQGDIYAIRIQEQDDPNDHGSSSSEVFSNNTVSKDERKDKYGHADRSRGWKALKIVYAPRDGYIRGNEPHNVLKEVELLRKIDHPNIITLLNYTFDEEILQHRLTLPLYPMSLSDLFQDPSFSPTDVDIPKIISYQLLNAISYLHSMNPPIAHRDVNPSNVMFDKQGRLKLIDFGIAYSPKSGESRDSFLVGGVKMVEGDGIKANEGGRVKDHEWEENVGRSKEDDHNMCCDVGTGSYRAPELLFSPRSYDPLKVDLWSVGCIVAQFFRPYGSALDSPSSDTSSSLSNVDSSDSSDEDQMDPLDNEPSSSIQTRRPLLDSTYGSLGLASSIFKVLGKPSPENWPGFTTLPDSDKIDFSDSTLRPISDHLPLLRHLSEDTQIDVLEVIEGLLRLDPESRIRADLVLVMRWVKDIHDVCCKAKEEGGLKQRLRIAIIRYGNLESETHKGGA
ncbi:CMGC/CDK protein kinase [Kwoniella mangroviensis CBS 10435]|uniref:CMGC/CDK protein kinase n=1 Tax=Kwoniella mangroviensis CBS 10435 TaxID=1331196 RepID=A0A1B9J190_9TREE|nr:CMGC/CDK protein kinase [Kwoniella mangroviensis CBS 10435]